jgi:ABC-2 type transport system ATP-binding protein
MEALEAEYLKRLPHVKSVSRIDTNNWSLETDNPEALRKAILDLSVKENLNIVSMQTGSESLEAIFRSLTT